MGLNKSIKIGMASAYFATMKGGGEHYTLNLSNKLSDLGYDITIICGKQPFTKPDPLSTRFKIEYVPQLYFLRDWGTKMFPPVSYVSSFIHYYQYMFSCYNLLLKKHNFDIIHTHDPSSLWAAIKIKKRFGIPVVSTFHGIPSSKHINEVKNIDLIMPVSNEIKYVFEKNSITNIHEIPGGVDLSLFKAINKEKCKKELAIDGIIILFVGRLIPIKNLPNLLCAFKQIQSIIKDSKLLIIGDGPLKKYLMNLSEKLSISKNVIFKGPVSYKKLPIYYNAADVFILPSFFESFPLVALEATACGVPIAISKGAEAFIKDFGHDHIFVFDPGDIGQITDVLINILTNEKESKGKVRTSLIKIQSYDWTKRAQKVSDIYQERILRNIR